MLINKANIIATQVKWYCDTDQTVLHTKQTTKNEWFCNKDQKNSAGLRLSMTATKIIFIYSYVALDNIAKALLT